MNGKRLPYLTLTQKMRMRNFLFKFGVLSALSLRHQSRTFRRYSNSSLGKGAWIRPTGDSCMFLNKNAPNRGFY